MRPLVAAGGTAPATTVRLQAATVSIPGLATMVANPGGAQQVVATKTVLAPAAPSKGEYRQRDPSLPFLLRKKKRFRAAILFARQSVPQAAVILQKCHAKNWLQKALLLAVH